MKIYLTTSQIPLNKIKQSELSLALLDFALLKEFEVTKRPKIVRTKLGKPIFADFSDLADFIDNNLHFSYSHCDYGVACVVSEANVGVDVQERSKQVTSAVIKRAYCSNEVELFSSNDDFLKAWVQKEAYSKFTGRGLSEGFKSIDTTDLDKFQPERVFLHDGLYIAIYGESVELTPDVTLRLVRAELL
ncbi:MAG: 4'-phosphopantetheinyl transferase superfamily protein [Oscillospiraceae bacterium]|nr:4'-phosphopantetheinyl transferase superfamily protein [Oscillospiraceae bacterium]